MKVAVSSVGPDLASAMDPRFGRCSYLVFVETESGEFKSIANPNVYAAGGAGIQTAQLVLNEGVEAVITGTVGPNAHKVLSAAGVKVYIGQPTLTIAENIELFKAGQLQAATLPTVGERFGLGRGMGPGMGGGPGGFGKGRGGWWQR